MLDFELQKSAYGIKNVTMNEWFFMGHFPQEPVMPGVLIIEALAQLSGVAMLANKAFETSDDQSSIYFVKIENCTFKKKVVPGDILHLYAKTSRILGKMCFFDVYAKVEDQIAAEGKIIATMA